MSLDRLNLLPHLAEFVCELSILPLELEKPFIAEVLLYRLGLSRFHDSKEAIVVLYNSTSGYLIPVKVLAKLPIE